MPLFSVCCSKGNEGLFRREHGGAPCQADLVTPALLCGGGRRVRSGSATAVPAPLPGCGSGTQRPGRPPPPGQGTALGDGCFCLVVICSHIPRDSLGIRNIYLNIKICEQQGGLYSTLNRAVPFLHGRLSI